MSGELWEGAGIPPEARRSGIGCWVILLVVVLLAGFVFLAALTPQLR